MDHERVTRWLVTGASGQLGRSVLELAKECRVEASGKAEADLDIADAEAVAGVIEALRPDVVLNCAAFTAVDLCEERPDEATRANEIGPRVLAEACEGGPLLVHVSSEYVFDGEAPRPIAEDATPNPRNVYGRTKLAGEAAVRASGAESLIVRSQWLFGPGRNFVRTILERAASRGEIRVVEDQIGRPTWTRSLAAGIFEAVRRGARGTLHLACEGVASWYDLAQYAVGEGARRGLNPEMPVLPISSREMPRPAARPAHAVLGLELGRGLGIELPHWRDAVIGYLEREAGGKDA